MIAQTSWMLWGMRSGVAFSNSCCPSFHWDPSRSLVPRIWGWEEAIPDSRSVSYPLPFPRCATPATGPHRVPFLLHLFLQQQHCSHNWHGRTALPGLRTSAHPAWWCHLPWLPQPAGPGWWVGGSLPSDPPIAFSISSVFPWSPSPISKLPAFPNTALLQNHLAWSDQPHQILPVWPWNVSTSPVFALYPIGSILHQNKQINKKQLYIVYSTLGLRALILETDCLGLNSTFGTCRLTVWPWTHYLVSLCQFFHLWNRIIMAPACQSCHKDEVKKYTYCTQGSVWHTGIMQKI